ncbi:MAG: DNA-binding transcriptional regulator, Lrp family [Chloroflexi bacterium AL-W]|nr:DNA-binding transcriptional regulator, Lrp family [Chloroflexi bacterium AL-N1]NOK68874.1 DNA-binding transcriptional regulator, Lrp family [Chloroflexi bacterium AL-N10]NOK76857.1 DNA-binding transcriptional regulator, Lrp family [Chloroflexi bacterium AL-N5]NOK82755.1 DNA-binding transcriptional regulator, Lrp family [Chloroflexi bacterium AL-W]NOK90714.1 DNA-binding transcriptional regulator, Lrp family [Chloroflexi bacterium AL-N15]
MMNELDQIDLQILTVLQQDGRISNADLAHRVGLTPPTVLRRVKLLEERGYIKGYTALIDPLALKLSVTAFIFVESSAGCDLDDLTEALMQLPGVQEVHRVLGEWCFLLKVRTQTPQTLEDVIYHEIRNHPSVRRTFTVLSTSAPQETPNIPVPELTDNQVIVE